MDCRNQHRFVHGVVCDPLESRRLLAAGDPDVSFSNDGFAFLSFPGAPFQIKDTALQSDGKIILAGTKGSNIAVARLKVDGTLDTSFGTNGLFESNRRKDITSVAVHTDPANLNKIVLGFGLASETSGVNDLDLHVGRLTANGSGFDTGFGLNGIAVVGDRYYRSAILDVAVQRDGKVIGAGSAQEGLLDNEDFAIVRYNADGTTDNTFGGGDAVSIFGFGQNEAATGVFIDYNGDPTTNTRYGTIVAAGLYAEDEDVSERFAIARMLPNGLADNSFAGDGLLISPEVSGAGGEIAEDVVVQPGGRIVVAGTASTSDQALKNFLIAGYTPAGALDPAFGLAGDGITELSFGTLDEAKSIALGFHTTVGNLVVSGGSDGFFTAIALTPGGQLDTRFSGDGILKFPLAGSATGLFATGPLYSPARRLIVAGGDSIARVMDVGSVITAGTLQPNMYEQNQQPTSFVVARTVALPFPETIILSKSGTVTTLGSNRDVNGTNITFGDGLTTLTQVVIPAGATFVSVTLTPIDDTRVEGDETLTLTAGTSTTYDAVAPNSVALVVRDNDVVGGPEVTSSEFLFETAPQRVTFRFNQDVAASVGANDFSVTGPSGGVPFGFGYDNVSNTATLSFASILPDANYSARAIAAGITNGTGQPLAADEELPFFFLAGDANRDRVVDVSDLGILATNWQQSPRTFSQADFSYDGVVDVTDLGILATNWQKTLPAPAGGSAIRGLNPVSSSAPRAGQPLREHRHDLIVDI
jgi:uncharacterized delta-60 repeat protein